MEILIQFRLIIPLTTFNNVLYGTDELRVYDATVYRLQEVSLSYSLPKKYLDHSANWCFKYYLFRK